MADRGIRIPLVADVADWLRGTSKVERSLDDLGGDLDQLARRADDNADDIARDFDTAFRRIERDSARAADDATDNLGGIRGGARDVGAEAGSEFVQSWGEAIRAGNPSEAVTETFTQAGAIGVAFGPVGAAVGLGVAAAAGLVTAFIGKAQEQQAAIREAGAALFDSIAGDAEISGREAAAAFNRGYVDELDIGNQLQQALGTETVPEAWQKVLDTVRETGLEQETVVGAYLGQKDAVEQVASALDSNNDRYERTLGLLGQSFDKVDGTRAKYEEQRQSLDEQAAALAAVLGLSEQIRDTQQDNLDLYRLQRDVINNFRLEGTPLGDALIPPTGSVIL